MSWNTRAEALRYLRACNYVPELRKRHKIVPTKRWSMAEMKYVPCFTIVLQVGSKQ